MIPFSNPAFDLTISRIIKASRSAVWNAWSNPASFEQWWIPAPAKCKVVDMEMRPGAAFLTQMSEDGGDFGPHLSGCFWTLSMVNGSSSPTRSSEVGDRPSNPS